MDPVTHTLTGYALGQFFKKKKGSILLLIGASLAPDIDYITRFWGVDVFLRYHRGITHGVIALVVIPPILGLIVSMFKKGGFLYHSTLFFIGYAVHLLMDLTNQYPTRILSPLDWSKYSLGLTFILDPYVVVTLFVVFIFTLKKDAKRVMITGFAFVFLFVYVGGKYFLKVRTEDFLRENLDEYHYFLSPLPNDFTRWWFVTESNGEYKTGVVDILTETVCVVGTYEYNDNEPEIRESKELETVKNFLYFARFPYPEKRIEGGETVVRWKELAYSFIPGEHFVARVRFDEKGRATEEGFRF
ncbi:MAG: metal-dependent hydrolase [Nitrospirae bacterium]|nr:MAG: metal-dependent hydrolase [Nitrospirota bacterium]